MWNLDRLTRRAIEVEQFIDLTDRHKIDRASLGGDVDLGTDNGRMFARIKGLVARAEVERKSARLKLANDQRAEAGKPFVGRRAFGYIANGMQIVTVEAAEIRKAAESIIAAGSLRAAVAGINAREIPTSAGGTWHRTELRVHRGEIVGKGIWPVILDQDTQNALLAVFTDPARRKAGRPRRQLLTGVARCSVCGGGIFGCTAKRGPRYY